MNPSTFYPTLAQGLVVATASCQGASSVGSASQCSSATPTGPPTDPRVLGRREARVSCRSFPSRESALHHRVPPAPPLLLSPLIQPSQMLMKLRWGKWWICHVLIHRLVSEVGRLKPGGAGSHLRSWLESSRARSISSLLPSAAALPTLPCCLLCSWSSMDLPTCGLWGGSLGSSASLPQSRGAQSPQCAGGRAQR